MRITLQDIHKHFGRVRANDGICLEIAEGTIHGILGENGAGKSTLMKVLSGYLHRTSGTILLDGRPTEFTGPAEATNLGIGMLYQDPLDFPRLTVLENFMAGGPRARSFDRERQRRLLQEEADRFGFQLSPAVPVRSLTVGERQQLELLRLLSLGVEVLILDEPTTGISSRQKQLLFDALRTLADQRKTILLVSHKLEDVESLCDSATVFRLGKVAGEMKSPFDTTLLLEWMFGTPPKPPPCPSNPKGAPVVTLDHVSARGGRSGLQDCSISLREGEVVGLAGLEGSGQSVFLRTAAGLVQPETGTVRLIDADMTGKAYHAFQNRGVTFLPAARLEEGLIPGLTLTEHFALQEPVGIRIPWARARIEALDGIKRYRIAGRPEFPVDALSGGNQQRLLLSLMPAGPRLLLLEQPTRGLDVESAHWVWEQLGAHAAGGACIVFSSSELEEIVQVAGRVLVFFNGRIQKDVQTCDTTLAELAQAVAGR
ncbi:MAG: sugar ABC transporter ATP-binding protein [Desulfobacteraceae bacterium]|jgi:simple sugar transport system ATP-binding protein